jgi:hypothetical protein
MRRLTTPQMKKRTMRLTMLMNRSLQEGQPLRLPQCQVKASVPFHILFPPYINTSGAPAICPALR